MSSAKISLITLKGSKIELIYNNKSKSSYYRMVAVI